MTRTEKISIWISCVSIVISLASIALSVLIREADDQQAVGLARDALRQVGEQEDKAANGCGAAWLSSALSPAPSAGTTAAARSRHTTPRKRADA